jgi:type I restriction enzyme, S subunit
VSKWPLVRLDQIADVSAGNPAPQGAAYFDANGHPFVRMQDVGKVHESANLTETVDHLTDAAVIECGLRLYPKGTLLIPKSGASVGLNHRAMLGRPAYVVSHLATIVPDRRRVNPAYLFHWSTRYDPRKQAQVTSLPSLPLSLIKAASIPLPTLNEQRRIVALLDRAAEIRRRAEAVRAKARAIIPALFLDTFGDPTNPKAWATANFGDVLRLRSGDFLPTKRMEKEGIYPVYGGNGVTGYHSAYMFEESRIVIGRVGAYCGNIHISQPKSWITDNALYVARHPDEFAQRYLADLLKQARLNERASQAGQPLISAGRLATVPLMVPPLPVQMAYCERVQRIEALAQALDAAAAKAEAMAAALSAEVFGEGSGTANGAAVSQDRGAIPERAAAD